MKRADHREIPDQAKKQLNGERVHLGSPYFNV